MEETTAKLAISLACLLLAGKFDNHFWRIVVAYAHHILISMVPTSSVVDSILRVVVIVGIMWIPMFANFSYNKRQGCIMVTGCDSGMGQATAVYFAQTNDDPKKGSFEKIFAACFDAKASKEYFEKTLTKDQMRHIIVIALDVTDDKSCKDAAKTVQSWINETSSEGLYGIVQYHGIAFNGPASYMPVDFYERQLQVNFLGFVRVIQNFMPILKKRSMTNGRIILTGTGGGPCSPCPPLLSAYMSSKFATEAFCQSLRGEMNMTETNIECCMINPGFVKPTLLMAKGIELTNKMWKICEEKQGSTMAKDEYGALMNHFVEYSALQPGTHVSAVSKAAEHALLSNVPRSSYKVGIDSKLAPIVGMMPTGMRETIATHGIYGILSPAGTVKGYKV
ncbi:MAG: hypothetical protein SGBAC_003553 [Bacillariaceae sp.]